MYGLHIIQVWLVIIYVPNMTTSVIDFVLYKKLLWTVKPQVLEANCILSF